jgi:hypothetical protein
MSFRETLISATLPLDLSNDEIVDHLIGILVHRVPDTVCPSGAAIALMCDVRSSTDACYFRFPLFLFDAQDGNFCARFNHGNSVLFHLLTRQIYELPNTTYDNASKTFGGNLVCMRNLSIYSFETPISDDPDIGFYTATGTTIFPPTGYWDGDPLNQQGFLWDPINDIFAFQSQSASQGAILTYKASTGALLTPRIVTAGYIEHIANANPPFGYAFSRNNNVTQFNYMTGQVMAVGKLPDFDTARGAGVGERVWSYDRYNHRILIADQTDPDLDGNPTIVIRGFSPVPTAYAIIDPITDKQVQTNREVNIFTRVIGNAGEGIGSTLVNWADEGVGDVAPVEMTTDREGYAIAAYDGLTTGGAETITVTTEQQEGFDGSVAQGSGSGNQWVPTVHLDFNNQTTNADLSAILPNEQVHWDQAGGYGAFGDTIIARPAKTSSAELRIESGDDGIVSPAFGGDLVMDLSTDQTVPEAGHLWVGAWVYFPTGFDFSTSTDGLRLFQIRDSYWQFTDPDDDIVVEVRLKHGGGTTHTGYSLAWPNETVTDTRHDFAAHSSVLTSVDTWHFIQYYCNYRTSGPSTSQRLWIDDLIVWELDNDAAQYRDSGGGGSLTSFTANEVIKTCRGWQFRADELRIFRDWEGNAPSDQTCYVGNVIWTRDTTNALPLDENGNRYITKAFAENL